ncbi:MAG: peptidoglycan DD-metalloendopeptidase family protein [bacterium]|nr:peptidoglycan DD-metalloendopeptidase family protein [bacterium]
MISIPKNETSLVVDPSVTLDDYLPLDLSVNNPEIANINASSSEDWERYINQLLQKNDKKIAYGGYLEKRNIYQRSTYFKDAANNRNIHLGVDFWMDAGSSVHAFLDGVIHSFQDNQNYGDYGPTIVLQHSINGKSLYSLYGHLSRESLKNIAIGQEVKRGEKIAELGDANVNGDYAPHLHFQLIRDLEGKKGDYPGVCTEEEVPKFQANCPNPLPLLRLL